MSDVRLSYSKLCTYEECPRAYYLENIVNKEEVQNAYAQYGSLIHDFIDRVNKKIITPKEALEEYQDVYDLAVTCEFPSTTKNASDNYYLAGYDYLSELEEVMPGSKILMSEQKHVIELYGVKFSGILDMVVELPDGRMAIVDHKSTSEKYFYGKKGDDKFRQLYIYAEFLKRVTGFLPDVLIFNCFRDKKIVQRDFGYHEYLAVMSWAQFMIEDILVMHDWYGDEEEEWAAKPNYFRCKNICSVRSGCREGEEAIGLYKYRGR